jgi:hypothetical protein
LRGVDGDVDRAQTEDREVGDGPFGPILGEQRHAIAGLDAKFGETERDRADAPRKLFRRDMDPLAIALFVDRVRLVVAKHGLHTQPRHRGWSR